MDLNKASQHIQSVFQSTVNRHLASASKSAIQAKRLNNLLTNLEIYKKQLRILGRDINEIASDCKEADEVIASLEAVLEASQHDENEIRIVEHGDELRDTCEPISSHLPLSDQNIYAARKYVTINTDLLLLTARNVRILRLQSKLLKQGSDTHLDPEAKENVIGGHDYNQQ